MTERCTCDDPSEAADPHEDGTPVVCAACALPRTCAFDYLGNCSPSSVATCAHLDYITCDGHLSAAVDNVASRCDSCGEEE